MYKLLGLLFISSSTYPMLFSVLHNTRCLPCAFNVAQVGLQRRGMAGLESEKSLLAFIDQAKNESNKINRSFLEELKYQESDEEEYSDVEEFSDQEGYLDEKKTMRRLRYIAAHAVFFRPRNNHLVTAVRAEHPGLVKHLLAHGANPNACQRWAGESVSVMEIAVSLRNSEIRQALLEAGADDRRVTVESIQSILTNAGFDFNSLYFTRRLTEVDRAIVLKNIMKSVNSAREWDFWFRTGGADNGAVYCGPENDGSYETSFGRLKGDWTHGGFSDLADYFKYVVKLRDENLGRYKKAAAQDKIKEIMKKYGIKKEDVTSVKKDKATSSRLQDSE